MTKFLADIWPSWWKVVQSESYCSCWSFKIRWLTNESGKGSLFLFSKHTSIYIVNKFGLSVRVRKMPIWSSALRNLADINGKFDIFRAFHITIDMDKELISCSRKSCDFYMLERQFNLLKIRWYKLDFCLISNCDIFVMMTPWFASVIGANRISNTTAKKFSCYFFNYLFSIEMWKKAFQKKSKNVRPDNNRNQWKNSTFFLKLSSNS